MAERLVEANGVEICTETFGRPDDPAVLLVMGAMAPMTRWDDAFCVQLAERGRFVVRYDHRDTGRSTTYPPGEPGYTISDLVDDAAAVLDAHGITSADVVGMSMGGMVGQRLAVRRPDRVRSLVALSTMAWGVELPDVRIGTDEIDAHFGRLGTLDWSDRDAVVGWVVEQWRLLAGTAHPHDAARSLKLATIDVDRASHIASMVNHGAMDPGDRPNESVGHIEAPVLVVHGTDDPLIPFAYAEAFIEAKPDAELLALPGSGHELHVDDWKVLIDAIVDHGDRPAQDRGPELSE